MAHAVAVYLLIVAPTWLLLMAMELPARADAGYLEALWQLRAYFGDFARTVAVPVLAVPFAAALASLAARRWSRPLAASLGVVLWMAGAWAALACTGDELAVRRSPVSFLAAAAVYALLTRPRPDREPAVRRRLVRVTAAAPLVALLAVLAFLVGSTPAPEILAGCYVVSAEGGSALFGPGGQATVELIRPAGEVAVPRLGGPPGSFPMRMIGKEPFPFATYGWMPVPAGGVRLFELTDFMGTAAFLGPVGGELRGTGRSWTDDGGRSRSSPVRAWRTACPANQ